jgi:hypothetical protein
MIRVGLHCFGNEKCRPTFSSFRDLWPLLAITDFLRNVIQEAVKRALFPAYINYIVLVYVDCTFGFGDEKCV